jgi:hypothetical protein
MHINTGLKACNTTATAAAALCCLALCRFVFSFFGHAFSDPSFNPDVPEHVLRPFAPPSLPTITPLTTLVVNNSYTTATPQISLSKILIEGRDSPQSSTNDDNDAMSSCPLSFVTKLLELRHLGLPLIWPAALEVSCKQRMLQEQSSQFTAAPSSSQTAATAPLSYDGRARQLLTARARTQRQARRLQRQQWQHQQEPQQLQLQQAVELDEAGSLRPDELFADLNEHMWRTSCLALQPSLLSSTASMLKSGAAKAASHALPAAARHALRGASQATTAAGNTAAVGGNAGAAQMTCENVSWHTARFMLPEYAQHVGRDSSGRPVIAADAALPVLWLNSLPSAFNATVGGGCCSLMDALQQHALPAAVQWVNEHIEQLPYLMQ